MATSTRRPHRVPLLSVKTGSGCYNSHRLSPKLDNKRLEKRCLVCWVSISLRYSDSRVRIWRKELESMDPSCLSQWVQAGGGGVSGGGGYSLGKLWPLNTNWALFKHHSLPEYCCWPCHPLWLQCIHLLMATSSRIMHHVTKLKSSQTGFLNMTMSSLYSNGLHSHQISIQ